MLDTSVHDRRHAEWMKDPEYRAAYDQSAREIAQTDAVIHSLDGLRAELGISKTELARRIQRNPASIRRLFTARQAKPALPTVAAIAEALGAEVKVVPRTSAAKKAARRIAV